MCLRGPAPDALGEERHADSHQLAAGPLLGLLAAQVLVAGDLHRDAHRRGVVAGVVGPAGSRLIRELLGADEAAHAQVDRVGLHLEGERVDHALDEVDGLGDAERAAVGDAAGRLVGVDRLDLDVRGLQVVGPADDVEEPGRELRRLGGAVEGAVVCDGVDSQARDLAVLRAHLGVHDVVAGKAGGHQVLGAVLDPLDRHAGHDRAGDRAHVARVDGHLVAKAAADVVAADPDHVLGEPRHVRVDRAVGVRRLVAVVEVELACVRVEVRDDPAGLERRRVTARVDDVAGHDGVGLRERAVGGRLVAGLPGRAREVVALAGLVVSDQRGVFVERLARVDDRRQRVVLDVDQRERVVGRVLVGRDHERDLLALEANLVAGEDGLRVVGDRRHPGQAERLEVLGRDDRGDVGMRQSGGGVDREDARVRVRAAQHGAVHHAREPDVVEVVALAADEARILLALQAPEPDGALGGRARKVLGNRHAGLLFLGGFVLRRPADGAHDVLVSGASADGAGDRCPDLVVGGIGVLVEQGAGRHQHPRCAEAALQRVELVEALLDRIQLPVDLECLDRADLMTRAHRRQDRARLDRLAVHLNDAGTAVGGVAAPVGARQAERLAQEVHEQLARLDVARDPVAVDRYRDVHDQASWCSARAAERRSARWVSTPARWRL